MGCVFKFERVKGFKDCFEFVFGLFWDVFGFPDSLIRGFRFIVMLVLGFGAGFIFRLPASWEFPVSNPTDGIFTVEAEVGANFVEDLRFLFSRSFLITQPFKVLRRSFLDCGFTMPTPFFGHPLYSSQRLPASPSRLAFHSRQLESKK